MGPMSCKRKPFYVTNNNNGRKVIKQILHDIFDSLYKFKKNN